MWDAKGILKIWPSCLNLGLVLIRLTTMSGFYCHVLCVVWDEKTENTVTGRSDLQRFPRRLCSQRSIPIWGNQTSRRCSAGGCVGGCKLEMVSPSRRVSFLKYVPWNHETHESWLWNMSNEDKKILFLHRLLRNDMNTASGPMHFGGAHLPPCLGVILRGNLNNRYAMQVCMHFTAP